MVIPGDRRVPKGNRLYDGTWRERMGHKILPLACRVVGHQPLYKMHDVICHRCRVVLWHR